MKTKEQIQKEIERLRDLRDEMQKHLNEGGKSSGMAWATLQVVTIKLTALQWVMEG